MAAAVVVFCVGVVIDRRAHSLFIGDYVAQQGIAGVATLPGAAPTLLPGPVWTVLTAVALVSGALLAAIVLTFDRQVLRRWRSWTWSTPSGLIWVFSALLGPGLAVYALTTHSFFDRYLWAFAFAVGVLLLKNHQPQPRRKTPRPFVGIVVALSGLLVVVAVVLTVEADTYSAARWHAGELLVSHGVPANEIDAGFEWVGAHTTGVANPSLHTSSPPYESWYAVMEPGYRDCGVVSGSPLSYRTLRLLRKTSYELAGLGGSRSLYLYISSAPGC
jgi:uncharacterized integral membrane protein